jgi:MFS transporter, DHA1 family, inner membrane transport protein
LSRTDRQVGGHSENATGVRLGGTSNRALTARFCGENRVSKRASAHRGTEVGRALGAVLVARTAANAGLRLVYPFLPAIARGLGVSVGALSSVVAIRNLGGLAAPGAALLAERTGRRRMMLAAMTAVALGCALTASTEYFLIAAAGIVLVGFAKPSFDVPMQAWFGDRVPYSERGRIFGITELTWAASLIIAAPLSGLLIARTSWRWPFALVAVLSAVGLVAVATHIRTDVPHHREPKRLELTRPRLTVLLVVFLFSVAAESPFLVYGQWLEGRFGLSVTGIGAFTGVVVVAELVGEGLVVAIADRIGLKNMLLAGLAASTAAYAGLAAVASLGMALVVVSAWIATFEISIVAVIPLVSELAAESRDRLLSLLAVVIALARALGALLAQPLYSLRGMTAVGLFSCLLAAVALLLILMVREPTQVAPHHT